MVETSTLELRAFPSIDTNKEITRYPEDTPSHFYLLERKDLEDDLRSKLNHLEK